MSTETAVAVRGPKKNKSEKRGRGAQAQAERALTPEEKALQATIDVIDSKIKKCIERILELRKVIEQKELNRNEYRKIVLAASHDIQQLDQKIREKVQERTAVFDKLKELREDERNRKRELLQLMPRGGAKGSKGVTQDDIAMRIAEIDERIAQLELKQQTTSLTMSAERAVLAQIARCRALRAKVLKLGMPTAADNADASTSAAPAAAAAAAMEEATTPTEEVLDEAGLEAKVERATNEIAELRAKRLKGFRRMEEGFAKLDANWQDLPAILTERNALLEQIRQLVSQINEEREKASEARYCAYKAQLEKRRAEAEAESRQRKAEIAEAKRRQEEMERAALEQLPYEAELASIKNLSEYVRSLAPPGFLSPADLANAATAMLGTGGEPKPAATASTDATLASLPTAKARAAPPAEIEEVDMPEGMQLLTAKKGNTQPQQPRKAKKQHAAQQSSKKSQASQPPLASTAAASSTATTPTHHSPDEPVKHRITTFCEFDALSLQAPMTLGAIPVVLAELAKKREYYVGLREAEKAARARAKKPAEEAEKKQEEPAAVETEAKVEPPKAEAEATQATTTEPSEVPQ